MRGNYLSLREGGKGGRDGGGEGRWERNCERGDENDWSMRSEVKKTLLVKRWDIRLSQFGSERFHVVERYSLQRVVAIFESYTHVVY